MPENILAEIVENARVELAARKQVRPLEELRAAARDASPPRDFAAALQSGDPVAVIAEVKKASPSKGVIREDFDPVAIARDYEAGGAAAISVLTDERYSQGCMAYLEAVRAAVDLPVLRKDFIFDPYQVWEARAAGADAVLLISEVLASDELRALQELAEELGMSALVESHDAEHFDAALASGARILGINNRDLTTFKVDLAHTERMAERVGDDRILVSESGIAGPDDVKRLVACGVTAVLVGESLMRADDIRAATRALCGSSATGADRF